MKYGKIIPIFIEFRKMDLSKNFIESLLQEIEKFGIELNYEIFEYLIDKEIIILLLDGFDEIPSGSRNKVSSGLDALASKYGNLKIIISSRPDYGLSGSLHFKKYKMQPLNTNEQKSLVNSLCKGNIATDINRVIDNNVFISEVITSPLLITLFVITYNSTQFNPNNLSEFYNVIFTTMLYRHDRLKLSFDRERASNLSDYNFQKAFEVVSFILLKNSLSTFSAYDFQHAASAAISAENLEDNIEDELIDDITKITALIIKDGYNNYSYAHKSIQEFFSAQYVKRSPNPAKIKFYKSLSINYDSYQHWKNVLSFLETIDSYMYKKYFYLNMVKYVTGYSQGNSDMEESVILEQIPSNTYFRTTESGKIEELYWPSTYSSSAFNKFHEVIFHGVGKFLELSQDEIAEFLAFCDVSKYENYYNSSDEFIVNLMEYLTEDGSSRFISFMKNQIKKSSFYMNIVNIENEVKKYEKVNRGFFSGI